MKFPMGVEMMGKECVRLEAVEKGGDDHDQDQKLKPEDKTKAKTRDG
jgi:hypothetical protein